MRFGPPGSPLMYRAIVGVIRPLVAMATRPIWSGLENLPRGRGFVVVSNHISYSDPLVLAHYLNDAGVMPHFLGKIEVFNKPVVGTVLRAADQIPVYRESPRAIDAMRAAVAAIEQGKCVVLYPEATLTKDPQLWPMPGKTGAIRIAVETGAPIIPVAQWGAHTIVHPHTKAVSIWPRKLIQVSAGAPMTFAELSTASLTTPALDAATDRVMDAITAQLEALRDELAPPEPAQYDDGAGPNSPAQDRPILSDHQWHQRAREVPE